MNHLNSRTIEFSVDDHILEGVLTHSNKQLKTGIVILHPHPLFGGNMENYVVRMLEDVFLEEGFSTLRFNFRDASQGFSGLSGAVSDALEAIKFMKSHTEIRSVGVVGYSFGASAGLRLALKTSPPFLISLSASKNLLLEDNFDIAELSKITCPTLMFHGLADRMIPPDDLAILSEAIGAVSKISVLLEGEGHFYQRATSRVVSEIQTFIRNLSL